MIKFRDLFRQLKTHPRMFLLSSSYLALVSFISGCDAATERRLLLGFDEWVSARSPQIGETSVGWPTIVAARHWPDIAMGGHPIEELPPDLNEAANQDLLELLDEFLAEQGDRTMT